MINKDNVLISACLLGVNCRYSGEVLDLWNAEDSEAKIFQQNIIRLQQKYNLIPVCSEILGGLPTPRIASEIKDGRVYNKGGVDLTENFDRGAEEVLRLGKMYNCKYAILKERSPSCGYGKIYDGSFSGTLVKGNGRLAELLSRNGIKIVGENNCMDLLNEENYTMINVLDMLESTAARRPQNIVFEDEDSKVTYEEFTERAKRAGTALHKHFSLNQPIPVFMEKSVQTLEVMFGTVYAGCFYAILDTHHPIIRINQILKTLESDVIVTSEKYLDALNKTGYNGKILVYEDIVNDIEKDDKELKEIREKHIARNPLYCNFTSGSTGTPKGVVVGHESVIDFITNFTELFNISENDVIGNQAPFDFDVSVKDIYSTIYTGAKMVIIPKKKFSFPVELMDYMCDKEVTTLIWAVSALCIISTLKGFTYKVPESVNKVIFSGEVMPVKHLNIWRQYLPDAMYVNVYGPTEITCNCTYYVIDKNEMTNDEDKIPIGKSFPNEEVFLLSEENTEIKNAGTIGEICVTGTCLALGYYKNKEQTDKAFVINPLNTKYPQTIYRTGDLGSYDEKGNLCYKGRKDFQIKHMGHRIELEEIEQAIGKIPEIIRVCVIFDKEGNNVVAFYQGDIDKRTIKKKLRESLPVFMIPTKFSQVEEFPLTKNGKTDRKKLLSDWIEQK